MNPILDGTIQNVLSGEFARRMELMEKRGRFDGQVALVTGGSRGIGAGIVRRLASEGAAVAFTYAAVTGQVLPVDGGGLLQ